MSDHREKWRQRRKIRMRIGRGERPNSRDQVAKMDLKKYEGAKYNNAELEEPRNARPF